ncbi:MULTISPECIES: MFS transporter [unclassified Paenibacillus]|uniref:MFS transporter n=1 Tax=unclassified Paenibacillus TaxID=185978 RepID=UPI001C0FA872|nr:MULTISPECIES: MFS transporter [unclassified Paenibacillus]MBU5444614.1 MFS transporter [Paenibacillus sp. MSJ-34]CAH0122040.1 Multidrug resistance protein MdtG [Paenibacillus sp. CECT 9249]
MMVSPKMNKAQRIGLTLTISILFIDMLLYSILIPIIPYYNELLQPSATAMGVLFGSYAVAMLAATPFFGKLSDRIGRRKPLLLGLIGLALSTVLFMFAGSMFMLIAARFIQGIAAAATWTAALALVADLFPQASRGKVMGFALTGISTGSLLGAPVGGWLFEAGGHMTPFVTAAGLTLLNFVLVLFLLQEGKRAASEQTSLFSLLRNRSVLYIAIVILLAESCLTLMEPTLPVFLTEHLLLSPLALGLLFGAMTLAYGVVAPVSGSLADRYNPRILMLIGLGCLAVTMPLIVVSQNIWQVAIAGLLAGGSVGFALSPTLPTLGQIVDRDGSGSYGVAYSLFNMFHAVGMIIGPLVGGVLTDMLTVPAAIVAVGITVLASVAALSIWLMRGAKTTAS